MEQKINIAELLRDCPKGMELDCINYNGVVTFEGILDCDSYPIKISVKYDNAYFTHTLTKYGQTCISPYNKCIIFPKGKTTWEGFHRPFKDGDILSYQFKGFKNRTIYIYKQHKQLNTSYYVALSGGYDDSKLSINNKGWMALNGYNDSARLATEEEKEKLFKAIKDNGYKWNAETKTLEKITTCLNCRVFKNMHQNCPCSPIWTYKDLNEAKSHLNDETNCRFWTKILETTSSEELIEPKFKVGDWVTDGISKYQMHFIDDTHYWYSENCILGSIESVDKQYHLWTIKDAKDGDVVTNIRGAIIIYRELTISGYCSSFVSLDRLNQLIPHYDSYLTAGIRLSTEEEKQKLFQAIKENGYKWNSETKTLEKLIKPKFKVGDVIQDNEGYKVEITEVCLEDECYMYLSKTVNGIGGINFRNQDNWELIPDKFDITTLKPFNQVLVRTENFTPCWTIDFYDGYRPNIGGSFTPFGVSGGKYFQQCIPYKGNEHLAGTTKDCDKFYKTWEK